MSAAARRSSIGVLRELKAIRKAGKIEPRRMARVVGVVSKLLADEFLRQSDVNRVA